MKDKNEKEIIDGSIIDIHQTVNGRSEFIVLTVDPLDIRYAFDIMYKYEYDKEELVGVTDMEKYGETDVEIIGNIYN